MTDVISITSTPTFRDLLGRFAAADTELLAEKRERMRVLGRRMLEIARDEAPSKSGKFRNSLIYRTFEQDNQVGFNLYSAQPLGTYIVMGTKAHKIAPKNANALYFYWPKVGAYVVVPKSGGFKTHMAGGKLWVGKGYVNHPGTQPNPYNKRAYERWEPEALPELRRISTKYIQVIQEASAK